MELPQTDGGSIDFGFGHSGSIHQYKKNLMPQTV